MKKIFFIIIFLGFICCDREESAIDIPNVVEQLPNSFSETISGKWYNNAKDSVKIIAHGGASAYEPFNSILAFKKAFDLAADGIELDLVNSKDDSLMVFHDMNTKRYTGVDLEVVKTNSEVLRKLDIGKGEKIPYLREVFEILPVGKKIYIELKWWQDLNSLSNRKLLVSLLNQIKRSGRFKDCIVLCFNLDLLIKLKMINPDINIFWINNEFVKNKLTAEILTRYNFQGANVKWSILDNDLTNDLQLSKKFNYAWTINEGSSAIDLYQNYKIDGIYTDKPDVIREALEKVIK